MITVKQLMTCPKKAWFGSLKLRSEKSVYSYYEDALKTILEKYKDFYGFLNRKSVEEIVEEMVPEEAFSMKLEREENLSRLTDRLVRMGEVFTSLGFDYAGPGKRYVFTRGSKSLGGNYTFLAEKNGCQIAVKVTFSSSSVSMKPGTKSFIGNDVELYVQQLATGIIPAVYSLTGSESWGGEVKEYTQDQHVKSALGRFLFYHDFSAGDNSKLDEEVERLLSESVGRNARENRSECSSCWYRDLCQMDTGDAFSDEIACEGISSSAVEERKWTDAQEQLSRIRKGEAKVFAVAGSGKTTSLSRLVAELLNDGVSEDSITLCTFTNKGVAEMFSKFEALKHIKPYDSEAFRELLDRKLHIVSLNGLGYEIIRENARMQGEEAPKLIDADERLLLIAKIADRYPVIQGLNYTNPFFKQFNAEGAVHTISRYADIIKRMFGDSSVSVNDVRKAVLVNPSEMKKLMREDDVTDVVSCSTLAGIYNDLLEEMKSENVLTYDDQIFNAVKILKSNDELRRRFQKKCQYLIVDEFQDTGLEQLRMIENLYVPSDHSALVVVGDTSQSIMGFRGVGNENIARFDAAYPDAVEIRMNQNFRSTEEICTIAENVMAAAGESVKLETVRKGDPVEFISASSRTDAAEKTAEAVEDMLEEGVEPSDIAVICRTRSELVETRKKLAENSIPAKIAVAELFRDDVQIRGIYSLADFIASSYTDLRSLAVWLRSSNRDAFDNAIDLGSYIPLQGAIIKERYEKADDAEMYRFLMEDANAVFGISPSDPFKALLTAEEGKGQSFVRIFGDLQGVFKTNGSLSSVKDDTEYQAVTLTTVHSAKGREWKNVIVCTNGFKARTGLQADANGDVELAYDPEEVRTMFVAVTRAKDHLCVIGNCYWKAALKAVPTVSIDDLTADGVKAKAFPKPKPKSAKAKK